MNSFNPIIRLQPACPPTPSSTDGNRTDSQTGASGFANALAGSSQKPPARRSSHKSHADDGGGNLPASGNAPPTTPPPATAPPAAPAAASAGATPGTVTPSTKPAAAVPVAAPPAAADPAAAKAAATAAQAAAAAAAAAQAGAELLAAVPDLPVAVPPTGVDPAAVPPGPVTTAAAATGAKAALPAVDKAAVSPAIATTGASPVAASSTDPGTTAAGSATANAATDATVTAAAAAAAPPVTTAQGTVDPTVAALLAQATVAPAAATQTQSSTPDTAGRVIDTTLLPTDGQSAAVGDAASLSGTAAAAPALSAALAGAAEITSAVAGLSADKHSKDSQDVIAAAGQAALAPQAAGGTTASEGANALLKVQTPVDSPDFSQNVASQVSMMVDNNQSSAKLQVNPPSLGPIEVRIALQGEHAQVSFSSHSALTRDALESSSPHLREMLGAQGFTQVSVDISHRSFQERTPTPHSYDWSVGKDPVSTGTDLAVTSSAARGNNGVLDAYA